MSERQLASLKSEIRGRVRKAPPIDVSAIEKGPGTEFIAGGWIAEVVAPHAHSHVLLGRTVWGSWQVAMTEVLRALRRWRDDV